MKRKVKEMQQEAERLDELQKKMADEGLTSASASEKADSKEADSRSIYVGNVCLLRQDVAVYEVARLITVLHLKSSKLIFSPVGQSTVLQSCVINGQDILKGS